MIMEVDKLEEKFETESFSDYLPIYYQRLFPFHLYYQWLTYKDEKNTTFTNREFSFTLKDDVYLRYQSFKDEAEMRKEVVQRCPHKIDIGAVFSFKPKEQRKVTSFHPVEKELVFDIDMTDYDEVRTCCTGANVCNRCWPFMTVALRILDRALREDFGFQHLLWVFSGRRGIHCWVCDEKARKLSPHGRAAIVDYLTLVKGGEYKAKKVYFPEILHPSIESAAKIVTSYFPKLILENQNFLEDLEDVGKVAKLCLDPKVAEMIQSDLRGAKSGKARWEALKRIEDIAMAQTKGRTKNKHFSLEVMFQMCYPRLDANVSKGLNHLLKAPFCVHPKTGKVCVPIDIKHVDQFDPLSVPTISQLWEEIEACDARFKEERSQSQKIDYANHTSLKKSINIFQAFVEKLNKKV